MNAHPFVSVIIPTYGREKDLALTIAGLAASSYPRGRFEILVVDQTETHEPDTRAYLEKAERDNAIGWFRPPEISFASLTRARNFGLDKARDPDIVIFVDDDVEVGPEFIQSHVDAYADPGVGATVGRVTVPGKPEVAPDAPAGKISWFGAFTDNYSTRRIQNVDTFIGCNFSVRADVFAKAGRFEEAFMGNALREDSDMAVRITRAGFHIRFVPKAYAVHKEAPSGGTRSQTDRIRWYYALFYNNFLFYRRFAPAWRQPFFVLHMWRPILACSFWYGKGRPAALAAPWKGMRDGWAAARASFKEA